MKGGKDEEFVKTTTVNHQDFANNVCKSVKAATQTSAGSKGGGKKLESHSRKGGMSY